MECKIALRNACGWVIIILGYAIVAAEVGMAQKMLRLEYGSTGTLSPEGLRAAKMIARVLCYSALTMLWLLLTHLFRNMSEIPWLPSLAITLIGFNASLFMYHKLSLWILSR